jgi:dihydrofolate synthase/folylpolyglutamate synthase
VVVLDVAHNAQAVGALAASLDAMGFHRRTFAVFGAMRDKDIPALIAKMAPLVERWFVCELPSPRAASAETLMAWLPAQKAEAHASPVAALAAARAAAQAADRIVVFGSFLTVGAVLREGLPR